METVHDLTQEELEELRESYFLQLEETDPDVLGDAQSPKELPMSVVKDHYEGVIFVADDFFCNQ